MEPGVLDQERVDLIKKELMWHPEGRTISALASKLKMNRNLVAKYLDLLHVSGQVRMKCAGTAKVYRLLPRVPFSSIFEELPECMMILDDELQILRINRKMLSLLNVQKETIIGKKPWDIGNPLLAALPHPRAPDSSSMAGVDRVAVVVPGKSSLCHVQVIEIPVVLDNRSGGYLVLFKGLPAPKRNLPEEPVRIPFHGLVEDSGEFIVRFHPDGTLISANPAYCQYVRKDPAGIPGNSVLSCVHKDDQAPVRMSWRNLTPACPAKSLEFRVIGPSGDVRWNRWIYVALFEHDGQPGEYLGIGKDTTDIQRELAGIDRYIADISFLSVKAYEFAELPEDADIYEVIGRGVREILPDAVVLVNSFHVPTLTVTVRCFLGDKDREIFSHISGQDPVGCIVDPPENFVMTVATHALMSRHLTKIPGNFHYIFARMLSKTVADRIEMSLNTGNIYLMGLIVREVPLGVVIIFLRKGDTIARLDLIEAYLRQAALCLQSRRNMIQTASSVQESAVSGEQPLHVS